MKQNQSGPERIQNYIIVFFRITIIIAIIGAIWKGRWDLLFSSSLIFIFTFIPLMFEKKTRINLPIEFEFMIILFIYLSLFLGEIHGYYSKFWWWDVILHTGSGVGLGFVGFIILYTLYKKDKVQASPIWISIFAFFFAVGIGAIWEVFEFGMDTLFGFNMQKNGLIDTMWDLIVDSLGALLTSTIGYYYLKEKRKSLFSKLIHKFLTINPYLRRNK